MQTTVLRRYQIKPGEMDAFLVEWQQAARMRKAHGFNVLFAFVNEEISEFTWAVRYDGDEFDAATKRFKEDPGNEALLALARFLDDKHVAIVRSEPIP